MIAATLPIVVSRTVHTVGGLFVMKDVAIRVTPLSHWQNSKITMLYFKINSSHYLELFWFDALES